MKRWLRNSTLSQRRKRFWEHLLYFESQDLEKNSTGNLNRKRKEKKVKINDIRVLFKRNVHAERRDVEIVKSHNATEIEVINFDSE